jgi:hypothetical protein
VKDIQHPVLGQLVWNDSLSLWAGECDFRPGQPISVIVEAEPTSNIDELLRSVVSIVEWARHSEAEFRRRIEAELLDDYNDSLSETGDASNPGEFHARMTPGAIVRNIDGSGSFYWNDGEMFGGHTIQVWFTDEPAIWGVGLAG